MSTQVVSDVTGREHAVPEQTIGACYGDALMAAIGCGLVPAETDWARVADVVDPTGRPAGYHELFELYTSLYPATKEHAHALARIQELGS